MTAVTRYIFPISPKWREARLGAVSLIALGMAPISDAQCKAPAERYEIVDLSVELDPHVTSRAVAIDRKGRTIISIEPTDDNAGMVEVLLAARGKTGKLKQADDGAERRTLRLLDNGTRLVDYRTLEPGYLPLELKTLIDRRGGEMTVQDYCKPPADGWMQRDFTISDSGKTAAAVFEKDGQYALAQCNEDMSSEILHEDEREMSLSEVTNDGVVGGYLAQARDVIFWRWDDQFEIGEPPAEYSNLEISGMDIAGNLIATTTGEVTSAALRFERAGGVDKMQSLPGTGWDVLWQVQAPCGEVFGKAVRTNIEDFLDLSPEKQAEKRDDMRAFLDFAAQREDAHFIWHESSGGRFMSGIVEGYRNWTNMNILDVNTRGEAVGSAMNAAGETRAIAIRPVQ